jgi:beta-lactamase class A
MIKKSLVSIIVLSFISCQIYAQHLTLRSLISKLSDNSAGHLGVFIKIPETGDTLSFHNQEHYVMQSVFKFPIAMLVLKQVDEGKLKLDQKIFVRKADLHKTVSALYEKYPDGNVDITVREMLEDMITRSDNNACDLLLKLVKGPAVVQKFINGLGISDFHMKVNENEMAGSWERQYLNWTTPSSLVALLEMTLTQKILSEKSNNFLRKWMRETYVTPKRIRFLLPIGTIVEHRSGTSGTNEKGLSPATNDIATITLPNGRHLCIAVMITDSYADDTQREAIIAKIAKAAFEEFSGA